MCKSSEESNRFEQPKEIQERKEFREQKAAKMRLDTEARVLSFLDINVLKMCYMSLDIVTEMLFTSMGHLDFILRAMGSC